MSLLRPFSAARLGALRQLLSTHRSALPRFPAGNPVRTALQTLGAVLVAVDLAVWAVRHDAAGTAENLIADVLLAAAAAVGFRMFAVRRARAQESRDLSDALDEVRSRFAVLQEQVEGAKSWSVRRLQRTDDTDELRDLKIAQDRPWGKFEESARLTEAVEDLAAEHGTIDVAPLVEQIAARYAVMWEAMGPVDAALDRPKSWRQMPSGPGSGASAPPDGKFLDAAEINAVLEALHTTVVPVADDVALLRRVLDEGYPPGQTAEKMLPDDFPLGIAISAFALGAVALLTWIVSAVRPEHFPNDFSSGILGNVLPGCVGLAVGAGVATVTEYAVRRSRAQRSIDAVNRVTMACTGFAFYVSMAPDDIDFEGLRASALVISDCVNQLQHVKADARLQRYSFLLQRSINAFLDGKLKGSLDTPLLWPAGRTASLPGMASA